MHWFDAAAVRGQLEDSFDFQRARIADEPGQEGGSLSRTDWRDGAHGVRTRRKGTKRLAEDAFALLPEPRWVVEVVATAADGDPRTAGTRRREGNVSGAHFVRDGTH